MKIIPKELVENRLVDIKETGYDFMKSEKEKVDTMRVDPKMPHVKVMALDNPFGDDIESHVKALAALWDNLNETKVPVTGAAMYHLWAKPSRAQRIAKDFFIIREMNKITLDNLS